MGNRKLIGIILVVAILLVTIGYAAITSINLNISGSAKGSASQANFRVRFTGKPVVSDAGKVVANIVNDTTGEINVTGLSQRGDKVTAKYTVENASNDISADLAISTTNSNTEYFLIKAELDKISIKAGETTVATVTVELLKTPITTGVSSTIGVTLEAMPVSTGQEGTSEGMNGSSQNPIIPVSITEIFDKEGTNPNKLHIGDFVNYDAGTWTQQEINEIKTGAKSSLVTANGSTALPTQSYQFGGFTAGSSRNGNATPFNTTYNYVKDKATGQAITGWRVFDVEGDKVTLISAGNPEDYYHPYGTNYAYISEYILTGNINSSWANGATEAGNYQKRDWSKYVNTAQKAQSATSITKSKLDSWYTKYTNTVNADTYDDATFRKIYQEPYIKYQSMVDNYSYYRLSAAYNSEGVYGVGPYYRNVGYYSSNGLGVRVLVSLKSEVKFTPQKVGTKTVTGENTTTYGGDQTYNVWGIR